CVAAVCTDLSNEENILSLGLQGMDTVVVAMSHNLEASILATVIAKELGVPYVVVKSSSGRMSSIMRKVGVDKVIIPDQYAGMRSAAILVSDTALDYFRVGGGLCMIEMVPLSEWIGKSMSEINIREKFDLVVVARKDENDDWILADPEKPFLENSKLLVVIDQNDLKKIKG
ncbi:MAG: TrkA family potassium uptake protein, partial [Clostridia bacterium]|nr:TrkA family potassium uptake protein [Clostridia bacterium]